MSTAARGPSNSSAVRSAAYETDNVEPLRSGIGRLTFHTDVTHAANSRIANKPGRGYSSGNETTRPAAPTTITNATYACATVGRADQARRTFGVFSADSGGFSVDAAMSTANSAVLIADSR